MARKYTTLRKKLRELEAKVVELLTLPPETPHHDLLSDGVEQRLASLKALVSAEMAAHAPPSPTNPTHHLLHITEKLSELEVAFREWDHCRSAAVSGVDHECSCGESGMNDDVDDDDDDDDDYDDDDGDVNMEELGFKVYDVPKELREDDEEGRLDEKNRRHVRRRSPPCDGGGVVLDGGKYYYRVWATGAVLGAFSMAVFMARFSACFYVVDYLGPLTPT